MFDKKGYLNATLLCRKGKKKISDWTRLRKTQLFLKELSIEIGKPKEELVICTVGGNHSGSWVHPYAGTYLAQWISAKFAVKVSKWIDNWKSIHQNTQIYKTELEEIQADDNKRQKEKEIQARISHELKGQTEVLTESGYIDVLTNDEIIEIKIANKWMHAMGQILCYASDDHFSSYKKRIHLFDVNDSINIHRIKKIYNKYNISLTVEGDQCTVDKCRLKR